MILFTLILNMRKMKHQLANLLKTTQLVNGRTVIWTKVCLALELIIQMIKSPCQILLRMSDVRCLGPISSLIPFHVASILSFLDHSPCIQHMHSGNISGVCSYAWAWYRGLGVLTHLSVLSLNLTKVDIWVLSKSTLPFLSVMCYIPNTKCEFVLIPL